MPVGGVSLAATVDAGVRSVFVTVFFSLFPFPFSRAEVVASDGTVVDVTVVDGTAVSGR